MPLRPALDPRRPLRPLPGGGGGSRSGASGSGGSSSLGGGSSSSMMSSSSHLPPPGYGSSSSSLHGQSMSSQGGSHHGYGGGSHHGGHGPAPSRENRGLGPPDIYPQEQFQKEDELTELHVKQVKKWCEFLIQQNFKRLLGTSCSRGTGIESQQESSHEQAGTRVTNKPDPN